jgi:hypothetical protein
MIFKDLPPFIEQGSVKVCKNSRYEVTTMLRIFFYYIIIQLFFHSFFSSILYLHLLLFLPYCFLITFICSPSHQSSPPSFFLLHYNEIVPFCSFFSSFIPFVPLHPSLLSPVFFSHSFPFYILCPSFHILRMARCTFPELKGTSHYSYLHILIAPLLTKASKFLTEDTLFFIMAHSF